MAGHTWMHDFEAQLAQSRATFNKQMDRIEAKLAPFLQPSNILQSSLHGVVNSTKATPSQPLQSGSSREFNQGMEEYSRKMEQACTRIIALLQEGIDASDSLKVVLPTSDESSVSETKLVVDDGKPTSSSTIVVAPGDLLPSTKLVASHSAADYVGRLTIAEAFVRIHGTPPKSEVQIAQFGLEVTTETTLSFSRTRAAILLQEPSDAALFSEWARKEVRWFKEQMPLSCSTKQPNAVIATGTPDWTHDAVANPPLPPDPPDLRCCGVAGRRSLFKGSVAYLSHRVTTKFSPPKPPDGVAILMPPWEPLILKRTIRPPAKPPELSCCIVTSVSTADKRNCQFKSSIMADTLEILKGDEQVLYNAKVFPSYVHKIFVGIGHLLIDDGYYAYMEGSEILSNFRKAAGLAPRITVMRPHIDTFEEYVRATTARSFSVVAYALGIPILLPLLKATCQINISWQPRHNGLKIVQRITTILISCAVLFRLRSLIAILELGLKEENQKVGLFTALSLAAFDEAVVSSCRSKPQISLGGTKWLGDLKLYRTALGKIYEADTGFAMEIQGTQVAIESFDIIILLLHNHFASIVNIVKWGWFVNTGQLLWVHIVMDIFDALTLEAVPPTYHLVDQFLASGRRAHMVTPIWRMNTAIRIFSASLRVAASVIEPQHHITFQLFNVNKKYATLVICGSFIIKCASLIVAKLVECLSMKHWMFKFQQVVISMQSMFVGMLYAKGLTLFCQSKEGNISWEIINLMTAEAAKISEFCWYMHAPWLHVFQVALAFSILLRGGAVASLASLTATVIMMLLNFPLASLQDKFQGKILFVYATFSNLQTLSYNSDATQSVPSLCDSTRNNCLVYISFSVTIVWEDEEELKLSYPIPNLEDKVAFKGEGNVMIPIEEKPRHQQIVVKRMGRKHVAHGKGDVRVRCIRKRKGN